MKLIIDIPEDRYKDVIEAQKHHLLDSYAQAIANGTPIPDNATNGEVIKILFADFMYVPWKEWLMIDIPWYDAPYQKGGKE